MKKSWIVISLIVILSLAMSACSGEVLQEPQSAAGNPVDPTAQAQALAAGPKASMVNVWDSANLRALKPVREIVNAEYGIAIKAFKEPGSMQEAMLMFPAGVMVAESDGPQIGPNDVFAIVMWGTAAYYLCVTTVKFASQAIGQVSAEDFQRLWASLTAFDTTDSVIMQMARHSDPSHNPNFPGTQARVNISAMLAAWATLFAKAPNGGPDHGCGAVKDGAGNIVRWVIWIADAARDFGGYIVTINLGNPQAPYVGSYDLTRSDWEKGMDQNKLNKMGQTWSANIPCPGNLPSLQPATAIAH